MTARIYLYGVVEPYHYRNLDAIGVDDALVLVVPEHDLGVAFSAIERDSVVPTKAALMAHERVLERLVAECDTVLPFSFGTLAQGQDAIRDLFEVAGAEFRENISRVRGCIEVGLKVFWQKDAMRSEVERITGSFSDIEHRAGSVDARQIGAIQVGQAVEQLVRQWRERYVPVITATLDPVCQDWKENDPFGPTMLWNGAFLVRREQESSFQNTLADLDRRLGHRLDFRHVAPLPAYNFVEMRLGLGRGEDDEGR